MENLARLSVLDALFSKTGLADKSRRAVKQRADTKDTTELAATCRHPELGSKDPFHSGANGYATWENPVLYFQSVIDSKNCAEEDVGLGQLSKDLTSKKGPPNLSLIYPDPCDNGSDAKCSPSATTSGTTGSDSFLQKVLPKILASNAYKAGGLVIVTFDQSIQTGPQAGLRHYSCCGSVTYPNISARSLKTGASLTYPVTEASTCTGTTTSSTTTTTTAVGDETETGTGTTSSSPDTNTDTGTTGTGTTGTCVTTTQQSPACFTTLSPCNDTGGGGDVGMIAISPYIKAKSIDTTDTANDFSLLYELEDLFDLPTAIGDSANPDVQGGFDTSTFFNNPSGS